MKRTQWVERFISFLLFLGFIILLVWLFTGGTDGTNQYGDDPKCGADPEFDY